MINLRLLGRTKNWAISLSLVATMLMISVAYAATLEGDVVRVGHQFPALGEENIGFDVTVVDGTGDTVRMWSVYTVDVDPCSINVDFRINWTAHFTFPVEFNGLVVSDLATEPTGLVIETNLTGWDDSRASFTADSVMFDFQGIGDPFDPAWYLVATIEGCGSNKSDSLRGKSVPGKGIGNAPGLQKEFNPKSKAARMWPKLASREMWAKAQL